MRRPIPVLLVAVAILIGAVWIARRDTPADAPSPAPVGGESQSPAPVSADPPLPGEALMADYGDPATAPIDDLRALDRVLRGYFSIIKDHQGHAIGGNEDLAACLRGDNAYRQAFLPADHPAFGPDGRLLDRWGTPVFVHPLAAEQIEFRAAGPDRTLFTDDDVTLGAP